MIIYNLFSLNYNNTVFIISVITVTFDISCSLVLYPDLCDSVLTQRDVLFTPLYHVLFIIQACRNFVCFYLGSHENITTHACVVANVF